MSRLEVTMTKMDLVIMHQKSPGWKSEDLMFEAGSAINYIT